MTPSFRASAAVPLAASVLLSLAALAAPAAAQEAGAAPRDTLPPVSAYLDSAAAVRALAALPAPVLPEGIAPLFSIGFDITGAVDTVYGVYHQLPAAFTDTVVSILHAHARWRTPVAGSRSPYVRVAAGPGASIAAVDAETWAPELSNRSEVARLMSEVRARHQEVVGSSAALRLRFRVLATGYVEEGSVRVLASPGDDALNADMAALAHHIRFRPAQVAGIPVHMTVMLPMTLQSEGGRRGVFRVEEVAGVPDDHPLATLADTAGLVRALAALPPLGGRGQALLRVRFDDGGAVQAVEPVSAPADDAPARALAEAVRPHLTPRPQSTAPSELYLRVVTGPGARVERHAGTLDSSPALEAGAREALGALRAAVQQHGRAWARTILLFAVRADGSADPASVEFAGTAPTRPLALELGEIVGRMRFRPAVIDDAPARAWVRIPLWVEEER